MSTTRKRRWIDVLRRTAGVGDDDRRGPSSALDDAALWTVHERATTQLKEATVKAERVAATLARQRAQLEAGAERASLLLSRAEAVSAVGARVQDAFDKLSVVALNAGLEGARSGEPLGRALLLLSEEIRTHAQRGADASQDLAREAGELAAEASDVRRQASLSRGELGDVAQEAAQLQAAAAGASKSLDELGARIRRATGIDPELARVVALAADHARGLMGALSSLAAAAPGAPVLSALRPVIGPLVRLLGEIEARASDEDDEGDADGV